MGINCYLMGRDNIYYKIEDVANPILLSIVQLILAEKAQPAYAARRWRKAAPGGSTLI
jgi:hypothetical protein